MDQLWKEIDYYTALGYEITFKREGYNTNFVVMVKGKQIQQSALPDDHMPESIPKVLEFIYHELNKKK